MRKVGITGQNGFIGSHLLNRLSLLKDDFLVIPFDKSFFNSDELLVKWLKNCDVVIHLAALNRHENPDVIYNTNILLVEKLLKAFEIGECKPHVLISSSTQEENNNVYGTSKKIGRELIKQWSDKNNAVFTGMIIPNVFGPFGKPFYNSVIATFCYQLCNNQTSQILKDAKIKLIYIDTLIDYFIESIRTQNQSSEYYVPHSVEINVSSIYEKLFYFKQQYLDAGIIPSLDTRFDINLFNTFRSYIDLKSFFPCKLKSNIDNRGSFVELAKLNIGGQVSISTTVPGVTRGNHFHTRKIERFVVIKGKALIELRKYNTDVVISFEFDGEDPSFVDMPVWYIHNIKNIGTEDLYTVFWVNEFYNENDPDTYFEKI